MSTLYTYVYITNVIYYKMISMCLAFYFYRLRSNFDQITCSKNEDVIGAFNNLDLVGALTMYFLNDKEKSSKNINIYETPLDFTKQIDNFSLFQKEIIVETIVVEFSLYIPGTMI